MTDNNGLTALLHAVQNNNEEVVKLLIPFEADLVNKDSVDVLVDTFKRAYEYAFFYIDRFKALISLLSTSKQGNITGLTREERLEMVGKMAASEPEQKLTRLMVCA